MFASDSILGYETDTEVVHQPDCRSGDLVRLSFTTLAFLLASLLASLLAFCCQHCCCCFLAPTSLRLLSDGGFGR